MVTSVDATHEMNVLEIHSRAELEALGELTRLALLDEDITGHTSPLEGIGILLAEPLEREEPSDVGFKSVEPLVPLVTFRGREVSEIVTALRGVYVRTSRGESDKDEAHKMLARSFLQQVDPTALETAA